MNPDCTSWAAAEPGEQVCAFEDPERHCGPSARDRAEWNGIWEPWMAWEVSLEEIPGLRVLIYHPTGVGPWGYIQIGSMGPVIGYGPVKECRRRVADLQARLHTPAYPGAPLERPLFPEAVS